MANAPLASVVDVVVLELVEEVVLEEVDDELDELELDVLELVDVVVGGHVHVDVVCAPTRPASSTTRVASAIRTRERILVTSKARP